MEIPTITAFNRKDFRAWLARNFCKEKKVKVVLHKKHTGKNSPSHREMIEEAICFGWIDTIIKKIDKDTYSRSFSKRNENSRWSANTLSYAKDLIKKGLMTEEGMKYYKLGLKRLPHDHGIPKNPDMPEELKRELEKRGVKSDFDKLAPSIKRMLFRQILYAKRAETKIKRVEMAIGIAVKNNKT